MAFLEQHCATRALTLDLFMDTPQSFLGSSSSFCLSLRQKLLLLQRASKDSKGVNSIIKSTPLSLRRGLISHHLSNNQHRLLSIFTLLFINKCHVIRIHQYRLPLMGEKQPIFSLCPLFDFSKGSLVSCNNDAFTNSCQSIRARKIQKPGRAFKFNSGTINDHWPLKKVQVGRRAVIYQRLTVRFDNPF